MRAPAFAVLDMRLEDGNGMDVIDLLHARRPSSKMVMLTGYGNLATAVAAVKRGMSFVGKMYLRPQDA